MLPIAVLVILIGFLVRSWLLSFVPTVNAMKRFSRVANLHADVVQVVVTGL